MSPDIFVYSPPRQTLKAWRPFWDCVDILFLFQNSDVDDEHPEWRIYWVAGIALLRTVGHVLAKSDAAMSANHKAETDLIWKEWNTNRNENSIFWDFVERERNNLLKTYSSGAKFVEDDHGGFVRFEDGEDAMQLYREAVYWWRYQLMKLEDRLSST